MTEFKQLQETARMTNQEVADYFEVDIRTVSRWRSGENKPNVLVMREMGNLATAQVNKETFGDDQ
jgi:DNA-binding transcriptional regulator YiaG